jgi:Endonuclease/Exonuclease/phosphatase family
VQQTRVDGLSKVEGEALVTRFPIIEPGNLDYHTRDIVALVARVVIEERTVDFYGTHLHMSRGDDSLRLFQVQQLLAWIDSRADGTPSVVCGDFNASLDAPSARLMATRFRPTQTAPTVFTPLADREGSHPYWPRMDRCTDYIWISDGIETFASEVCFNRRALAIHRYSPPTMPVFGPICGYEPGFKRFAQASRSSAMTIPQVIPFFSAAANFAAGTDMPGEFLERCLARLESFEPDVGAFVCHDIAAARAAIS